MLTQDEIFQAFYMIIAMFDQHGFICDGVFFSFSIISLKVAKEFEIKVFPA